MNEYEGRRRGTPRRRRGCRCRGCRCAFAVDAAWRRLRNDPFDDFDDLDDFDDVGEFEDIPGLTAAIAWRKAVPLARAQGAAGGGVYVMLDAAGKPLKVGWASDFGDRFSRYTIPGAKVIRGVVSGAAGRYGAGPVMPAVENAVARTLLRLGYALPDHKRPVAPARVQGTVRISHLVPPGLGTLAQAYAPMGGADGKGRAARTYSAVPAPAKKNTLVLTRRTTPQWETGFGL